MMIHRKLSRYIFPKKKKKKNSFTHPIKVLQPVETVAKRLSFRMVKVKEDHEALEERFPQAAYSSPAISDIHNCQLKPVFTV